MTFLVLVGLFGCSLILVGVLSDWRDQARQGYMG